MKSAGPGIRCSSIHACAILLGENGVLIRGPSGSGKSALALALVEDWTRDGAFARLIADDRVILARRGNSLIARLNSCIAGLIEVRSLGIVALDFEQAAVVRLVIDLVSDVPDRLPDADSRNVTMIGVKIPVLRVHQRESHDRLAQIIRIALRHESND